MTQAEYTPTQAFAYVAQLEASGQLVEAKSAYEQILAQNPQCAPAWHGLGLLLLNAGKPKEAAQMLGKAVAIEPNTAIFHRNFAEICRRLGLLDQAITSGKAAIALAATDLDAHTNLGLAFSDAGNYVSAIVAYRKALKINPNHSSSWNNLGAALEKSGDVQGALKAYNKASLLDPSNAQAKNNQGVLYVETGDLDSAIESFDLAIKAQPDFVQCHYNLSSLKTYTQADPHLAMLKAISSKEAFLNTPVRIQYNFALGKALEDVGDFDRSFAAYEMGNHLQHSLLPVDEAYAEHLVEGIKSTFTKEFFQIRENWKGTEQSPIFIVGMPRSGTTLLEQILSSHDSVYGAGELVELTQAINTITKLNGKEYFFEKVPSLSVDQIKKIGAIYVEKVWQLSPQSTFISDKMPANFLFLGLIHLIFPNAKIIHAMRDPMDSCFSCFARLFNDSMDMTYDLETIGRYYVRYIKLMEHWQEVLPKGRILDMRYEDLVSSPQEQTRKILDFVGLPWDPNCLKFYENKRLVKTASLAQVNKPIYTSSVARWRHFAKHLKPLLDIVKDYRPDDIAPDFQFVEKRPINLPTGPQITNELLEHCMVLQGKGEHNEVIRLLLPFLNQQLSQAQVWHIAGISFYQLNQFEQAKQSYESALSLQPDFPLALNSYGFLLQDLGLIKEAHAAYARAVEISPEFSMARFNLGVAQLKLGDFSNGWGNYELRWQGSAEAAANNLQMPDCPLPKWTGQPNTQGQSLLVITEQGFGDTFQFVRYLSLAKQRFAKVGFVCSMPTLRLMEWSIGNEVTLFNRMPTDYSDWDWQSPLLSLPKAFETRIDTIPAKIPYLSVPQVVKTHWGDRIARCSGGRLKIGIAWAGRNTHQQDARRSIAFEQLAPLFGRSDIAWFSLQKWVPGDARPSIPQGVHWFDWSDEFIDFADTAALIVNLDLVISIDSAPVHLAGALNIPVWMLNRFDGEWRWLDRQTNSPWYPSLRIFNQTRFGNWSDVVQAIAAEIALLPAPKNIQALSASPPQATPLSSSNQVIYSTEQAITLASQLQYAGKLTEALQVLMQALELEPNHAQALHLYGVLLHQVGRFDESISSIKKAIAANPQEALFYSNLGEMCRQRGDLSQAINLGHQAVALNPMLASAHGNLGVALFDVGDLDGSQDSHCKALALEPELLQSLNMMGSIERARKNKSSAINWYQKALAIQPHFLESMSNLGATLVESDQSDEAVQILEKAIELEPNYPAALCNLGLARIKQNRIDESIGLLERSLELLPGYREAMVGLARAHYENGNLDAGLALLHQILSENEYVDAYCLTGLICTEKGLAAEAVINYEKVLNLDPANIEARNGLGNIAMEAGEIAKAKTFFLSSLAIDQNNVDARFYLTQAEKVLPEDGNTAALEDILKSNTHLSEDKKISVHYALGKAYDDLQKYDDAFGHFVKGAKLKRNKLNYNANQDNVFTDKIIKSITKDFFLKMKGHGDSSTVPIFILGMPRSGTTLVEQIIASHPEVYGAGELPDLFEVVQHSMDLNSALTFPGGIQNIDGVEISKWGHDYVQRITAHSPSSKRITDKMPANYMLMGLIPLMMPNAKIIHVMRDPVDTCLSCFTRLFNRHQNATYDLKELGQHYLNYRKLMDHWREILPPASFMDVRYEDLVDDIEGQSKRLMEYCDLGWDDRCLSFHQTKRSIRTASVTQVRQPIYRSSMERWRKYEKHLTPLLDVLLPLEKSEVKS